METVGVRHRYSGYDGKITVNWVNSEYVAVYNGYDVDIYRE